MTPTIDLDSTPDPASASALLDIQTAAAKSTMSYQFIRGAIIRGELPAMKLGNRWRIKPSDLATFLDERRTR